MKKLIVWLLCTVSMLLMSGVGRLEAGEVKTAPDGCSHAQAVLGWSTFEKDEQHKKVWSKVGWVMGRRKYLSIVGDYEAGVAQKAAFRQFKVKGHEHGNGYVVQCGHGGTCNEIVTAFYRLYKGIGTPVVYCGKDALPRVLEDGATPNIPIPTDEELAAADGDDDDDDDDAFDDDDD